MYYFSKKIIQSIISILSILLLVYKIIGIKCIFFSPNKDIWTRPDKQPICLNTWLDKHLDSTNSTSVQFSPVRPTKLVWLWLPSFAYRTGLAYISVTTPQPFTKPREYFSWKIRHTWKFSTKINNLLTLINKWILSKP